MYSLELTKVFPNPAAAKVFGGQRLKGLLDDIVEESRRRPPILSQQEDHPQFSASVERFCAALLLISDNLLYVQAEKTVSLLPPAQPVLQERHLSDLSYRWQPESFDTFAEPESGEPKSILVELKDAAFPGSIATALFKLWLGKHPTLTEQSLRTQVRSQVQKVLLALRT